MPERIAAERRRSAVAAARRVLDRVRSTPGGRMAYRTVIACVGLAVTGAGLVMVPFPGPGWLVVFVGLAILASEFVWAQRLLHAGRRHLAAWTAWLSRQHLAVRLAAAALTAGFVAAVVYVTAVLTGVPDWVPDELVPPLPGLHPAGRSG